jgi:hypothetical protein
LFIKVIIVRQNNAHGFGLGDVADVYVPVKPVSRHIETTVEPPLLSRKTKAGNCL